MPSSVIHPRNHLAPLWGLLLPFPDQEGVTEAPFGGIAPRPPSAPSPSQHSWCAPFPAWPPGGEWAPLRGVGV